MIASHGIQNKSINDHSENYIQMKTVKNNLVYNERKWLLKKRIKKDHKEKYLDLKNILLLFIKFTVIYKTKVEFEVIRLTNMKCRYYFFSKESQPGKTLNEWNPCLGPTEV